MSTQLPHPSASSASDRPEDTVSSTPRKYADTCVICFEIPQQERAVAVPCNHSSFCFVCLASWAQERPSCPLCKCALTAIEYDWRAPDDFKTYTLTPLESSTGLTARASWDRPSNTHSHPPRYGRHSRGRRPPSVPRLHQSSRDEAQADTDALTRRRLVYTHNLFSLHVGSNRISRFRSFTPSDFLRSSELQSRARTWIRRELRVFDFLMSGDGKNAEFMLSYIIAILKVLDIKGSNGLAEEKLAEFLGREKARLFLHELESWLRSPFARLEYWDRSLQYRDVGGERKHEVDVEEDVLQGSSRDAQREREILGRYEPD